MLRNKIKSGALTVGTWMALGNTAVAEILAKAGFEWIVIDLEHTTIGIETAGELIRVVDLAGAAPLVRLTSNDPHQIKRVMDAGAHGVVVPMVNSPDEAASAVAATRYAPKGCRGVGLARAQGYGADFSAYLKWQEDGPIVVAQIEHKDALARLDKILAVEGVDAFIIGPYDLSCSMGIPGEFDNPNMRDALARIRDAGRRCRKAVGIHVVEPEPALFQKAVADGFSFIAYSVDMRMIDVSAREGMAAVRSTAR